MRKSAVFATVMGVFAASALSALATYHLMQTYEIRKKERDVQAPKALPPAEQPEAIEPAQESERSVTEAQPTVAVSEEAPKQIDDADRDLCYYLPHSRVWHSDDSCAFIAGKSEVITATIAEARAKGRARACSRCGV